MENSVNNIHIEIDRVIFDNGFDEDLDRKAIDTAIKHYLSRLLTDHNDAIVFGSNGHKDRGNRHDAMAADALADTRDNTRSRYFQVGNIDVGSFDIGKHELGSSEIGKKVRQSIFKALTKINTK